MLPFEIWPAPPVATASPSAGEFPYYVKPLPDEALFSWLLRLATRLGVSLKSLAQESFGVEDWGPRVHWWCRPHPWLLKRISERTGVGVAQLRRMTFHPLAPCYRNDDEDDRFNGLRYLQYAPGYRKYTRVVCPMCLHQDAAPYIRWSWLLGWMAVCPKHNVVLITRCPVCRTKCRVAVFSVAASFSPTVCTRCGESLLSGDYRPATPSVLRLQTTLLSGKCTGVTKLERLGVFTWPELIALMDVLQGMYSTARTDIEQMRCDIGFHHPIQEEIGEPLYHYSVRHTTLRFIAWLTDGWPHSTGSRLAQDLLAAWLSGRGNRISRQLPEGEIPWSDRPDDFAPAIRKRLASLLD